jgi:hypothetical protein
MKPAPKLYALLKRAIKRESLRNKLQRSDEPESRVDQKTLEEQVCFSVFFLFKFFKLLSSLRVA